MAAPQYRARHQQLRAQLIAALQPGQPCPQPVRGVICGQPMYPGQRLELGHDDTGGYLGLVHARCNHQAGAIKGNRNRGRTCKRCGNRFVPQRPRQLLCPACTPGGGVTFTSRPW